MDTMDYVDIIKKIYGDSIRVTEDQITDEVKAIVNQMLDGIQSCTLRIAPISTLAHGIAGAIKGMTPGTDTLDPDAHLAFVEEGLKSSISEWLKKQALNFGWEFAKAYLKAWLDILVENKRLQICVNTAALNNKSRLAIALLGI